MGRSWWAYWFCAGLVQGAWCQKEIKRFRKQDRIPHRQGSQPCKYHALFTKLLDFKLGFIHYFIGFIIHISRNSFSYSMHPARAKLGFAYDLHMDSRHCWRKHLQPNKVWCQKLMKPFQFGKHEAAFRYSLKPNSIGNRLSFSYRSYRKLFDNTEIVRYQLRTTTDFYLKLQLQPDELDAARYEGTSRKYIGWERTDKKCGMVYPSQE